MSRQLNNTILRRIECPVCLIYMSKKIICCVRGHSICYTCGRHVHVCPICKRQISITNRNYALESICELLEYPCSYAEAGCDQYVKFEDRDDHRNTCSYRPYRCLLGASVTPCPWKGTRFQLTSHALQLHENQVSLVHNNKYTWNLEKPLHEVNLIVAYEELFLLHRKLVHDQRGNWTMHWAVQYVGKSEDKIQFYYGLHILCEEYEHRSITFMEYCCDDLGSMEKIISDDFCITVVLPQLETYQDKNKDVSYEVSIHRV